ncbi:LuxR C-terminal-related transcriptional regulator [Kitasatospora xanthocidica]|uniref:LuxR C-terminal-related transcriptional regulator n=1 Tax=Kitasatospora xanthocidica TaxID=83382 RepID=UPI0036E1122F
MPLTWQERRVSQLATAGLTNKEIVERIRRSPRTVSTHLHRVCPQAGRHHPRDPPPRPDPGPP